MKHLLFFSTLLLFVLSSSAQEKKTPPTKPAPAKTQVAPAPSTKDSALCKAWKITAVEEFALKGAPADNQKNDAATFMANKTAFVTLNGKQMTGSWELDKARNYITFTEDGGTSKLRFKLVKVDDKEMIYEWQDPSTQIRTLYYFEPLKK
jgi:hypothetical protein